MAWAAGKKLQSDRYIIQQVLGQGGFGITYQAQHTMLNRLVVIKTPNQSLKNDPEYAKYVQRFIEEGQRLEQMSDSQHPHIVRVRDLFKERGTYCLVMDFVPGENLFNLVQRRGALPETEAVEYVRQVGEALNVVHNAGLVHRDAHPGNIMIQNNGRAVLIDFGIAGEIVPTVESSKHPANPAFAPYEQISGSREPTVDIYCLAASLYYAVTSQRPTSSLDQKLNNVRLVPPKQLAPSISNELNRAILKGMKLEARKRPQKMQQWLKLLPSKEISNASATPNTQPTINPDSEVPTVPVRLTGASKRRQRRTTNIPWGYLAAVLLFYAPIGWLSANSAVAVAVALALALALAGNSPLAEASEKLLKSFSKFHRIIIVTGTSWLGIALGWLAHQIF